MGDVHRHHVGHEIDSADEARVIGHGRKTARRLEKEHGMVDVAEAYGELLERLGPARLVQVFDPRRGIGDGDAMARPALLRGGGEGRKGGKGECCKAHVSLLRWMASASVREER